MTLEILGHPYAYEMECLARLFYPGERIEVVREPREHSELVTRMEERGSAVLLSVSVRLDGRESGHVCAQVSRERVDWEWEAQRQLSVLLFDQLCGVQGVYPAWGILTGVRPINLCRKIMRRLGVGERELASLLVDNYRVKPEKAWRALKILDAQKEILRHDTPDSYSLYISIPFCPTRCLYCSFVSHAIDRAAKLLPDYLNLLERELDATAALADELGLCLRSVYIGGGTPTTLSPAQLRTLLGKIEQAFPVHGVSEYTLEAGRPDSITREKLDVLAGFGVSRVSVNPQTMDDTILTEIGRGHTAAQTLEAMELARAAGFGSINMDIIAGLPGQTPDSFADTLEQVLALRPENITVHTLTVKRSSELRGREDAFGRGIYAVDDLLSFADRQLAGAGYSPYYLYRQQGTPHNLENTGYCLPGQEGLYNIYSMEDSHTILAAGAGGVTKLCAHGGRMKRVFNHKYPYEYISEFETLMERKRKAREFYAKD